MLASLSTLACASGGVAGGPPPGVGGAQAAGAFIQARTSSSITETLAAPPAQKARFERISTGDGLSFFIVRPIIQDRQGFIWIGTYGGGLNRYDGYEFMVYKNEPGDLETLSHDLVQALYEDRDGDLWVGTISGLDRFDRTTGTFAHYLQGTVTSICEDSTGILWVGMAGSGLVGLDRATGTVEYSYHYDPNAPDDPGTLSSDYVWTMYGDRDGTLWVGTSGGLDRFDQTTETFAHYRHDPDDPRSLGGSSVHAIHEDRQGVLWFGTYGGGLNQMGVFQMN